MRVGHKSKEENAESIRDWRVTDLKTGPYIFIQTRSNKKQYHAPGMITVNKDWIYELARKKNWSVKKVFREKKIA